MFIFFERRMKSLITGLSEMAPFDKKKQAMSYVEMTEGNHTF